MIAPPPPPTAWHFDDGRGGALCGYAGAERITAPLHAGQRMFASRAGCCPDCWQEFWTGRLERPHYWYEEQDAMPTTKRKQRKQRAKKQGNNGAQNIPPNIPPGMTSTTTPAGIAALDPAAVCEVEAVATVAYVPIDQLEPHPDNRRPSPEAIAACAASLEATGQLEPLVVRFRGDRPLQIISGETRYWAARQLGWDKIAARTYRFSESDALRFVAEYNSHRTDPNAIERARLIDRLCTPIDEGGGGLTREQAARSVGLESASAASNLVRLLELPDVWQMRVAAGLLPQTYARVLLSVAATESTVWHHAEEVWHTWATRDDVDRFAAFMQGRLPSDVGHDDSDDEAEPDDNEPFPEKVVGSAPATTEPAADAASAAADDWEPEAADTTADDEPDGDTDADDEEVLDDDEPASVASEVPVAISDRLRGAVDEWQYDWLTSLVQKALAEDEDACWRLSLWLLALREDWIIGHVGKLWGEAADVDPLASPLECWRVCADHSAHALRLLTGELCQQVLALRLLDQDVLADLARMLELELADCWKRLQQSDAESDDRLLNAFYALHTAGELADLGRMVGVDVAQHRGKPARINALLSQAIPVPPYLRDWSAA